MKKALLIPMMLLGGAMLLSACRNDIREKVFNVPAMNGPECAEIIQKGLLGMEGVKSATPNYDQKTMAVIFDSKKVAIKNIEYMITGLGFDVDTSEAKPDAKANLPEGCN
ncbi:MAG: cation transporter [Spartobacteria bacterium]|nr:cation transporter [Spartobacteria bacterium]